MPDIDHAHLLRIVKELPTDYTPFGAVDREAVQHWADCSSGCRWYLAVRGKRRFDWGVCCNPASPRCGLLTFEHQGCLRYERKRRKEEGDG